MTEVRVAEGRSTNVTFGTGGITARMATLTKEVIEAAIDGFEAHKERIDAQIAELRAMLNGTAKAPPATPGGGRKKRKFSAEALQRMREAQQRRWAKVRGEAPPAKATKPKRKLSAAGRKAIVDALKKRWAAKKAQKS